MEGIITMSTAIFFFLVKHDNSIKAREDKWAYSTLWALNFLGKGKNVNQL